MTSEEWKTAEKSLSMIGSRIELKIDGYEVQIVVMPYKQLQNVMTVFVNGEFKFEWLTEDCEIRRKFCQKHKKSIITSKRKKELKKLGMKISKEILKDSVIYYYDNSWRSFRSLKSHFIKNCDSIELLEK